MHGLHQPTRFVRADRHEHDVKRSASLANHREVVVPAGVSHEVDASPGNTEHESGPEGAIAVEWGTAGEMLCRNARDVQGIVVVLLPPVELGDAVDPSCTKMLADSK